MRDRPDSELELDGERGAEDDIPGVPDRPVPVLPTMTAAQPIMAPGDEIQAVDDLAAPDDLVEPDEPDR